MFFMFIASGVCTPQGVWVWSAERHGSLLTMTLRRTKAHQPAGLTNNRGVYLGLCT